MRNVYFLYCNEFLQLSRCIISAIFITLNICTKICLYTTVILSKFWVVYIKQWCETPTPAPPEQDWAMAIRNTHKILVKFARVVPDICSRTDTQIHRLRDGQTRSLRSAPQQGTVQQSTLITLNFDKMRDTVISSLCIKVNSTNHHISVQ